MKGLKVIKARSSNAIDIYPLLLKAAKEKVYFENPSKKELEAYYFTGLLAELRSPFHHWYIARRGRGYLGFIHAVSVPNRWTGEINSVLVDMIYVSDHRRKMGIGKKLLESLQKDAENMGIKDFDALLKPEDSEHWCKKHSGIKLLDFVRGEV